MLKMFSICVFIIAGLLLLNGCRDEAKTQEKHSNELAKQNKLRFINSRLTYYDSLIGNTSESSYRGQLVILRNFLLSEKQRILTGKVNSDAETHKAVRDLEDEMKRNEIP